MEKMEKKDQLAAITDEITEKEKAAVGHIYNGEYRQALAVLGELTLLEQKKKELKAEIQREEIKKDDVEDLRSVEPARKSIQNMLNKEVDKSTKFEKLLNEEMGTKSAFEMRNSDNVWRNDDSKVVPVVKLQKRDIPDNLTDIRKRNDIPRGIFTNRDTGIKIQFGRRSIEETITNAMHDNKRNIPVEARIAALYQIKDFIENAVCFDSQLSEPSSSRKSDNTLFIHRMYGVFTYDDEQYLFNMAIEETYATDKEEHFKDTSNRLYNFDDIKITPAKLLGGQAHASPQKADTDTSTDVTKISIPQLYNFVKTYDINFYENPEAAGRSERETEIKLHNDFTEAVETLNKELGGDISEHCQTKGENFYETIKSMSEWADKVQEKAEKEKDMSKENDGLSL